MNLVFDLDQQALHLGQKLSQDQRPALHPQIFQQQSSHLCNKMYTHTHFILLGLSSMHAWYQQITGITCISKNECGP